MRNVRLSVEPSLVATDYPFTHRIRVRFAETDAMGIVHHSRYLLYMEETRVEYLRFLGHPYAELREAGLDQLAGALRAEPRLGLAHRVGLGGGVNQQRSVREPRRCPCQCSTGNILARAKPQRIDAKSGLRLHPVRHLQV